MFLSLTVIAQPRFCKISISKVIDYDYLYMSIYNSIWIEFSLWLRHLRQRTTPHQLLRLIDALRCISALNWRWFIFVILPLLFGHRSQFVELYQKYGRIPEPDHASARLEKHLNQYQNDRGESQDVLAKSVQFLAPL